MCPVGYQDEDVTTFCRGKCTRICDSDECAINNVCPINSTCKNLCRGFECHCNEGFIKRRGKCVQLECAQQECTNTSCPKHAECTNNCGLQKCECRTPYVEKDGVCVRFSSMLRTQYTRSYGDPHFHIKGLNSSQPDLCFDLSGNPGSSMVLIFDSKTGFSVVGTLFKPKNAKNIYFQSFILNSPNKAQIYFDSNGVEVLSKHHVERLSPEETHMRQIDDIIIDMEKTKHGSVLHGSIINGPAFE